MAIGLKPDLADAHNNLGNAFQEQGRLDEAIACFRKALELKPDFSKAASNLLHHLHFHPDHDAQAILEEHRRWARHFAEPLARTIRPHANDRDARSEAEDRIRLARLPRPPRRPVAAAAVLRSRSPASRSLSATATRGRPTESPRKLKAPADGWHDIVGLSDPQLADRIRADRIDILVDLALHTANNRMLVFARKPAPVQVTMLGLPATTGLATIDYRLTDSFLDPPGMSDGDYTEQSIRLPHCFWCYQPPGEAPPVARCPR